VLEVVYKNYLMITNQAMNWKQRESLLREDGLNSTESMVGFSLRSFNFRPHFACYIELVVFVTICLLSGACCHGSTCLHASVFGRVNW
jgi:hypothetical protein